MKRMFLFAVLFVATLLLVASCATKDECTADTDCAAGYTCGEDNQCHETKITLSFPDISEGQRFTVADDTDKSDGTIQLTIAVTATATSGSVRDGMPLTLRVTYPAGETTDDDALAPKGSAKSVSYAGILVSGRAQFLSIPFPEDGTYTLTAYLTEHPSFTASVSLIVDYTVAQTLVMRYYKGGTTPMVLEGATLDDNDDLDKEMADFQIKMEAVTTGFDDGETVQLFIDTETPALVGTATITDHVASFPAVTVPIKENIVMRVKVGEFEDTLTFDAVTGTQCTFMLNLQDNQRFGIADDEDSVSGLQKTLVISDITTCSTGSAVEIYVDRTPGTDTPTITTSLGGTTLERQITLPESADKEDTHTLIVVLKDDDTSATGEVTVTGLFVDLTSPTIEVTSPLADAVFFPTDDTNETLDGLQIEVIGTTTDALSDTIDVGVYYQDLLRGEFSGSGDFTIEDITFLETDEEAEITVTAHDAVGNETSASIPIKVYVNEPTIAFQTICGRVPTMHMQLAAADDTDTVTSGLQCAIVVRTNNLASDTTEVSLVVNGSEPMVATIGTGGLASFDPVTLPEGEVPLTASVTNVGEEHSSQITVDVDTIAPTVSFTQTPTEEGGLVNSRDASFTLACNEGSCLFHMDIDDGGWSAYTSDTLFAFTGLDDGDHVIEAQARDAFGNESTVATFHWTIDATAPVAPVVTGDTPTNDTTPTWTWNTVADAVEYRWSFDETTWTTTFETSYTPDTSLSEGNHTLFVQARDAAGNWSESGSFTVTVDLTAPEAPVVTGDTPTNDTTPTWTWDAVADAVEYRYSFVDGDNWDYTTDSSYTPGAPLSEGNHTLFVQARDEAGNWSESGSFTITVDLTAPVKPVVSGTTPTTDTTPTWDWISSPDAVEYRYSFVDGDNWAYTTDSSYTPGAPLGEGDHTLFVQARDEAGNWSESGSFTITVDTTPPVVVIDLSTPCTRRTTGTFTFTVTGATTITCRFDKPGGGFDEGPCTNSYSYTLDAGDGTYTLTVLAEDAAGNSDDASTTITLNTTTPTFQWYLPPNNTSYKAGAAVLSFVYRTKNLEPGEVVEIWDADANAKVAETTTAGSLCNATEDVSISLDLPDKCGTYNLYAKVHDSVDGIDRYTDNLTSLPATQRTYTFDRNKPVITSFVIVNDANHDNTLIAAEDLDGIIANGLQATIVVTVEDDIDIGRTVTLRNKTTGTIYTATIAGDKTATFTSITLPEGSNNLAATLIDCGGNVSDETGLIVTVDTTPPAVLFQGPNGSTPGHALWLTARDGVVNSDDELTGQILTFTITGDWNGATPMVKHIVYDYAEFDELGSYTYTAGEMTVTGTEVTIDLDASGDPFAPLAYNRHKFEVTVQDAYGNTRIASRLYEVDPIVPHADIAYPTNALVLDDTKDEDLSTSGVQFTLKLDLTKLATPTGTASTIDITAIPITAIGGGEDTARQRKSWNGFSATSDGTNQTFPNDGSFLRVGDGFWRLMVTVTDDHLNVFESSTVDVEVQTDVACFSLYLANDKPINGRQTDPTWLNTNDGTGTYDMYVLTDAPNGSTATLVVNGTTTYGPATVTGGRADFAAVALLTGGVENTLALTVNNGVAPATDTYYVRADVTTPTLDAGDMNPIPYVHDADIWEIGYGFDDDTNHDTTSILELTDISPNHLMFVIGNIEAITGYTTHGTVTLTAVSPANAIGGTTTALIVEDNGDMVAEFTDLTFEDSVIGGQTDIEMKVSIVEQPSGNTYERTIWVHVNLERPEAVTPVVTTNAARGSAFVQWNAVSGNNSAYAGAYQGRVYEYQVKYEAYSGSCTLDDSESVFDTAVAIIPLTDFSVADPGLNADDFVAPKAAGQSQSYLFYLKKRSNSGNTVTADIHRDGDPYCFAVRPVDGIYAQDGTILATNAAPILSSNVVDKGAVQLLQTELIAAANDGLTHPGQMKYIGDLNNDGITDVVFSDVRLQKVSVFLSNAGTGIPSVIELSKPVDAGINFGLYVSNGGDFNGDGYRDVLVYAAPNELHLFAGTANSISTTRSGNKMTTTDAISEIEAVGDFNGDGVEDFAVGQNTYSSNTGKVDIFFGSTNAAELATSDVTYIGAAAGDRFGSGIRKAGNLNGDAYDDFIAGTRNSPTKVKVFYGNTSPSGGAVSYDFTVFGNNTVRNAFYGNINGDTYDDIGIVAVDVLYLYQGSASGMVIPSTWTEGVNKITHSAILTELLGNEGTNGTLASNCTGMMRDIDGDGYDDIFLAGAYSQYLLSGTPTFLTLHPSVYIQKPITYALASVLVIENGLFICDRTSSRGDCVFYREQ